MREAQRKPETQRFLRCLERWDRWLQERLSPAIVTLTKVRDFRDQEFLWNVRFSSGAASAIRIPGNLIEVAPEEFQRVTDVLGTYVGGAALERAGPEGLRLECP